MVPTLLRGGLAHTGPISPCCLLEEVTMGVCRVFFLRFPSFGISAAFLPVGFIHG